MGEPNLTVQRPDPFTYHDATAFLKDMLEYVRQTDPQFSIRTLAKQSGVANGYISNVLGGSRKLTTKGLEKILNVLNVTKHEKTFLLNLSLTQRSSKNEDRVEALKRLQKFQRYKDLNKNEATVFQYFMHWYYPTIRELSGLPEFQLDSKWIQERLNYSVSIVDIQRALDFLIESKMIVIEPDGRARSSNVTIQAHGDVMRASLIRFHQQMFDLAKVSMEKTPRHLRNIKGQTFPIPMSRLEEMKTILDKALEDIAKLSGTTDERDAVYQFTIMAFPLTKTKPENPDET